MEILLAHRYIREIKMSINITSGTMRRILDYFGDSNFTVVKSYLDHQGIRRYVVKYFTNPKNSGDYDGILEMYERYGDNGIYLVVDCDHLMMDLNKEE